jgi:AsmA-like C-terminal region
MQEKPDCPLSAFRKRSKELETHVDTPAMLVVRSARGPRRPRKWRWVIAFITAALFVAAVCCWIVIKRAEPILRTRVIETLSARFKSRVDLAEIHVSIYQGLHVEGKGLKIYGVSDPNPSEPGVQPLLQIGEFQFSSSVRSLFREPMRVDTVFVNGLTMNIPPKHHRQQMARFRQRGGKMSIAVTHFVCTGTKIIVNTEREGKLPLEFDISGLKMNDIGPSRPLQFESTLVNPKPVGNIYSSGFFGPINENSPRDSAVAGYYWFTNADLGTFKGIGGILSSRGQYGGTLGRIEVTGHTDTPDFHLSISGHKVPLQTDFHAIVDATDGDTYLQPVNARVLNSSFTASGKIVRMKDPPGRDIELDVTLGNANIQDLLTLGVRTEPPIMTGAVQMRSSLSLKPGANDLSDRLTLSGSFRVPDAHFSNPKVQTRVDALSLRGRGKPKLLQNAAEIVVPADMHGVFNLQHGILKFSSLQFQVPGTQAAMTGRYSLDGKTFDFHGLLRLDAKLSQTTSGWKSILLKPIDPFFHKNGAGAEIPFKLTGTKSEPHFGLDLFHK